MAIKLKVQEGQGTKLTVQDTSANLRLGDQVQVVQSTDYNDLENKPSINGVTLQGDLSTEDLHIQAGVTSWNGQTGDVTYTPPNYELTYDESVSVGSAEVGEAVTGEPNYTPTGTVTVNGRVSNNATKENITVMYGGNATLNASYSNYVLTLSASFSPSTYIKGVVTEVGNPTFNGTGNFTGTGVTFAIEQEN